MTQLTYEQKAEATAALEFLLDRAEEFDYFTLTKANRQWECHLKLAYSGTQFVDTHGAHVVDIYAFGFDPKEPRIAVNIAYEMLMKRAQEKVDARSAAPSAQLDAYLTGIAARESAEDILKELGL